MDYHLPIMLDDCVQALNINPTANSPVYVDGTFGGGGHTTAIARACAGFGQVIAIDQDSEAIERGHIKNAERGLDNVTLVHDNFSNINAILRTLDVSGIDGALIDLGVSSHQLDADYRGFSYTKDARLDMRMNNNANLDAHHVVNHYEQDKLKLIFKRYGEEPFAGLLAKNIVIARERAPIDTTRQLFDLIIDSVPKKLGLSPVKRVFQAIRIEVNNELGIIEQTIHNMVEALNPGGRLAIITFHSLEDRIVKQTYNELMNPCKCPRDFPHCICGKEPTVKVLTRKPILPTAEEMEQNSRSKSAKLRILEKL